MAGFHAYLIDRNGDGFYDDAATRFVVAPDEPGRAFWSRLFDLAALIGLECHALPLPLFLSAPVSENDQEIVELRTLDDLDRLWPADSEPGTRSEQVEDYRRKPSGDMLDLFAPTGMLADEDGDLLPDNTAVGFDVPDKLPVEVGAALANLAARIGLESGGVSLPLLDEAERMLRVRLGDGPGELRAAGDDWEVEGAPGEVAALLKEISAGWPHFGAPETAGARYGVEALGRALAGDLPRPPEPGPVLWELHWSDEPETARLLDALEREILPHIGSATDVEIVAFACEPPVVRRQFAGEIEERLRAAGVAEPRVTVLSAFKAGLSWLREVVLPELSDRDVARLRVEYRRFEPETGGEPHLDMSIRWLQELFPGNEIAAAAIGIPLDAVEMVESSASEGPIYRAEAFDTAGASLGHWECDLLSYAMPFLPNAPGNGLVQVTTGGLLAQIDGETLRVPVDTDLDRFWRFWQDEVLRRVVEHIRDVGFHAARQPFFDALEVEVWLSAPNERLGIREETDSAAEALHEDIYFNALDTIEVLGLSETGEKTSAPGPVIPIVHVQPGIAPRGTVRLRAAPPPAAKPPELTVSALTLVDGALAPVVRIEGMGLSLAEAVERAGELVEGRPGIPALVEIGAERQAARIPLPAVLGDEDGSGARPPMDRNIHGQAVIDWARRLAGADSVAAWIEDYSYQGREIVGMALRAPAPGRVWSPAKLALLKPTALIVARHHANEISSTNAAFQIAWLCANDPGWAEIPKALNVMLLPYENPDGAALHARLAAIPGAATWKHHPARYNALGHEFSEAFHDPRARYGESRARPGIWRRWLPDALVDNHGVPSHEWVQPFAGFGSPPRFRVSYWIPQALIYGIIWHVDDPAYPEHAAAARALRDAVSAAIRDTDLGDLNREIGASYRFWGQEREAERFPGEFYDDMLWHFSGAPADPVGRGFNARYPRTTVLSWITEVNDETATGEHLERVARAHMIANRAMLDLMMEASTRPTRSAERTGGGVTHRFMRARPLRLGATG